MSGVTNLLLAGVGGQGVLLAGEVLADAALRAGFDVKKSEVHGMAQRGGSVVSHVRFGPEVRSPLIPRGEADFLVSFETLETLRYLDHLRRGAAVVMNRQRILPLPVSTGRAAYPPDAEERLGGLGLRLVVIDGAALATRAGNPKTVNAVVLGAMAYLLPVPEAAWDLALRAHVPARHLEVNLRAFALGKEACAGGGGGDACRL